jgi:hypothetical protein
LANAVSAGFTAPMLGEDARVHDVEVIEARQSVFNADVTESMPNQRVSA